MGSIWRVVGTVRGKVSGPSATSPRGFLIFPMHYFLDPRGDEDNARQMIRDTGSNPQRDSPDVDGLEIRREGRRQNQRLVRRTLQAEAVIPGRVEFPVQPRAEFQGLKNRSWVGQRGPHRLDRSSPSTLAKRPCDCC
jgi:hypothetical protein